MIVTRDSTVRMAFQSSAAAPSIFPGHGVRPDDCCRLCWDTVTLAEAEQHCRLTGVDRLVEQLDQAAAVEARAPRP